MVNINKLVLGIKTSTTMFRLTSLAGQIIDDILSNQGSKHLVDDYYLEVSTPLEIGAFALINKKLGNILRVERNNILFLKDAYELSDKNVSIAKTIKEFTFIWKILNDRLKVCDIRRIGIVAEHQVQKDNENKLLFDSLISFPSPAHPAKFLLKYEERRATKEGIAPDINKSDFVNVIYCFYDSELDSEHPTTNAVNMNIDFQRYYSPLISSNVSDEIMKLSKQFEDEERQFINFLKDKKLV